VKGRVGVGCKRTSGHGAAGMGMRRQDRLVPTTRVEGQPNGGGGVILLPP
jgi:hypothetical protein